MPPIYTSCFSRASLIRPPLRPISISRWPPRGWPGGAARYTTLAPSADLLRRVKGDVTSYAEFCAEFRQYLSTQDARKCAAELGAGAVMLCFCPPHQSCHRVLVAEWMTAAGLAVEEWDPDTSPVEAVQEAAAVGVPPAKGRRPKIDPATWQGPWEANCDHCNKLQPTPKAPADVLCIRCGQVFPVE